MYGIFTTICPKNHPVLEVNIPYMEHMGNPLKTTSSLGCDGPPSCSSSPKTIRQALPAKAEWKLTQLPRETFKAAISYFKVCVSVFPIPVNVVHENNG